MEKKNTLYPDRECKQTMYHKGICLVQAKDIALVCAGIQKSECLLIIPVNQQCVKSKMRVFSDYRISLDRMCISKRNIKASFVRIGTYPRQVPSSFSFSYFVKIRY